MVLVDKCFIKELLQLPSDPDDLTITGLDYAGDYTVTVTDANGCTTSDIITLEDGSDEDPFTVGGLYSYSTRL